MNTIIPPFATPGAEAPPPFDAALEGAPRRFVGTAPVGAAPLGYIALVPASETWPEDTVLRAVVADALQCNGRVVDEDTLDATVAHAKQAVQQQIAQQQAADARALAELSRPQLGDVPMPWRWQLQDAGLTSDGRTAPPFFGYAVPVPVQAQQAWVDHSVVAEQAQRSAPPAPAEALAAPLRTLAETNGARDVLRTIDAIQAAIERGRDAAEQGKRVDAAAVAAFAEFATRMGKDREAAKLLERYAAVEGIEQGVRSAAERVSVVFNGRDPRTGKSVDTDGRIESAFGLLDDGFKVAGRVGVAAELFGLGGGIAARLVAVAPIGAAVVAVAAGIYGLIKHAREAINGPTWDEFRDRFPAAEGMEPKQFLKAAMRQIAGMPTDAGNAPSTASRMLALFGGNPETRERYLGFLRGKVEPDALVDALAAGRFEGMNAQQLTALARAAKDSAREFVQHEIDDSKRYVRDRDGDRTRGAYLLTGQGKAAAERNDNRIGGAIGDALRVGGVLLGTAEQAIARVQGLISQLKGGVEVEGKPLDAQQSRNLAAAAATAAANAGLSRIDHLLSSKDGTRLFAVEGDPQSPTRRAVAIDVASAAAQGDAGMRLPSVAAGAPQQTAAAPVAAVQPEVAAQDTRPRSL